MEKIKNIRFKKSATTKRKKANARERNRMHALNEAFDNLRKCFPIHNGLYNNGTIATGFQHSNDININQKLSKIETLKLAQNYIGILAKSLNNCEKISVVEFDFELTRGLSQATLNLMRQQFRLDRILADNLFSTPCRGSQDYCDSNLYSDNQCQPLNDVWHQRDTYADVPNNLYNYDHGQEVCSESCSEEYFDTDSSSIHSNYLVNG